MYAAIGNNDAGDIRGCLFNMARPSAQCLAIFGVQPFSNPRSANLRSSESLKRGGVAATPAAVYHLYRWICSY